MHGVLIRTYDAHGNQLRPSKAEELVLRCQSSMAAPHIVRASWYLNWRVFVLENKMRQKIAALHSVRIK